MINRIYNKKLQGSITIEKKNAEDEPLQGAQFKLERYENGSWKLLEQTVTTDANGRATFTDLQLAEYRITETKAPEGYNLLNSPMFITIPYEMDKADVKEPYTGYMEERDGKVYFYDVTLTFYNTRPFDMPTTGGEGLQAVAIGVAIMMGSAVVACGCCYRKKKKRAG